MKPIELALRYLEIFFAGDDMDSLLDLFQPNLIFEGPFFKGASAQEYVGSLKADPPRDLDYEVLASYESEDSACIIYKFLKPNVSTTMVQQFKTEAGKISEILLVFDSKDFI